MVRAKKKKKYPQFQEDYNDFQHKDFYNSRQPFLQSCFWKARSNSLKKNTHITESFDFLVSAKLSRKLFKGAKFWEIHTMQCFLR